MIETRNSRLLAEFTEYCEKNPEQRFWQALRNWAQLDFIVAQTITHKDGAEFVNQRDTFYWENKND